MQPAQSQSSALWCARCVTLRRVPHCGLLTSFRFHALLLSSQDASSGFFFPSSCMYLPSKYIAPGIRSDSLHCKSVTQRASWPRRKALNKRRRDGPRRQRACVISIIVMRAWYI